MDTVTFGLIEFLRSGSEKSTLPKSYFRDDTKQIFYSSGIDYAPCNGIIEKSGSHIEDHEIEEAINFFSSKKLPFICWTNNTLLESHGFQFGGIMKGIVLDIKNSKPLPHISSPGIKGKVVETEEELNAFCKVIAECFGFSSEVENQYAKMCMLAMERKSQVHFLGLVNDIPVSTATLSTLPQSAGIWNCATLPAYRKRGIGTLLCSIASAQAKEMNYENIMAILMPKGLAWGVFNNLGYKETSTLPFYVYEASAHDLEK